VIFLILFVVSEKSPLDVKPCESGFSRKFPTRASITLLAEDATRLGTMRIDNNLNPTIGNPAATAASSPAGKAADSPTPSAEEASHVSDPAFLQLLQLVHELPQTRAHVIQRITQALERGHYRTPAAAQQAAAALLADLPS
jgi:hypothetical protein